eukprot:TRINITY_DN18072_c0_g1_i1.p1 TRINITY_DN18072_c0_g1~~TRINITY_DN18072_c0_g1_i1.p1  ORF type:complete len:201 (-),score=33.61 TRINITY_DN18072_c0_g1_i1:28-576(-)
MGAQWRPDAPAFPGAGGKPYCPLHKGEPRAKTFSMKEVRALYERVRKVDAKQKEVFGVCHADVKAAIVKFMEGLPTPSTAAPAAPATTTPAGASNDDPSEIGNDHDNAIISNSNNDGDNMPCFATLSDIGPIKKVPEAKCSGCGHHLVKTFRCSRCKTAKYCNVECQRTNWPSHKLVCTPPS